MSGSTFFGKKKLEGVLKLQSILQFLLDNHVAVVAEWLRHLTRNQIPSGSAGSNPADFGTTFM